MNFAQKSGTKVMEKKVRREDADDDAEREVGEEIATDAVQQEDGKKTMEVATVAASTASDTPSRLRRRPCPAASLLP